MEIPHENEIICAKRGFEQPPEPLNPLRIRHALLITNLTGILPKLI